MTGDQWARLEPLFHQLLELNGAERETMLGELAIGAPALADELRSLLAASDRQGALDHLLATVAPAPFGPSDEDALSGRRVRQYEVGEVAGTGGMGVVYRAHDTQLLRTVALKFMPRWLGADPAAQDRFLLEARAASALDHPNVCTILEIGRTDTGRVFLAMPFYEGETLKQRLARGPLAWSDAAEIARQTALGLAAAHDHGIVHRDIKPANLLLTADGRVKILDFGIAKLWDLDYSRTGERVGTVHYMAPEQAAGDPVDARTDLWSLGVVLHEMLTGRRPVPGERAALPAPIPSELAAVVERLLQRAPNDRYPDARAVSQALGAILNVGGARAHPRAQRRRRFVLGALALAVAAIGAMVGLRVLGHHGPAVRFGRATRLGWQAGLAIDPALSPDGSLVAYAAGNTTNTRVLVRQIAGGRGAPIGAAGEGSQSAPTWSPDGSRVLYLAGGAVFSAPASGGAGRQEVRQRPGTPVTSAAWSPDGRRIAFSAGDSLFIQGADRTVRFLALVPSGNGCRWSPDGGSIACASGNAAYAAIGPLFGNLATSSIIAVSTSDGQQRILTDSATVNQTPVWSPDGASVYFISDRDGPLDIYAVPADAKAAPVRLTTGLGVHSIALAADGRHLTYCIIHDAGNIWSAPLGASPVSMRDAVPVTHGSESIEGFSLSPDEKWLVYSADIAGNGDLFRSAVGGTSVERLTTDPAGDFSPDVSPVNPKEITFQSWRRGTRDIYVLPLDGGPVERVVASPREAVMPHWSPSGSAILFGYWDALGGMSIIRRDSTGHWSAPLERLAHGYWPAWSADGRHVLFATAVQGGSLMMIPVDSGPARVLVDAGAEGMPNAEQAYAAPDGREIFFMSRDNAGMTSLWRVPVGGGRPSLVIAFDDPDHPVYRPYWRLGRDRIYFLVQQQGSEIWVMDLQTGRR